MESNNKGLIIIIGAGPGISLGVARKFGQHGYKVALVARREERLREFVNQLNQEGIEALYATADVADESSLRHALESIHARAGHAEMILFNPSGFSRKEILDQNWQTIKDAIDISAGGFFHLMKIVLPWYLSHDRGKLFVTGGGTALIGDPDMVALSAGKAALRNIVQAFQKRVAGTNIHIAQVTVCGYVQSSDPIYNPDAIAEHFWKLFLEQPGEFQDEIVY